ncbi:MAG: UbiD family decarboxylase [Phycisphaerales bacterium]|jgi:4-hydroxy-3-polyprenylbenzoate decarboxylase|nr:UbiD family decarboxylase [Phycisphaerales bacterium]
MPHTCLQTFLRYLDTQGELQRITEPVSPFLEVTALAQAEVGAPCNTPSSSASLFDAGREALGGKALLVEHIEGCDFPLCVNVFGSYFRMEQAIGCADGGFEAIANMIANLTNITPPSSLADLINLAHQFKPLMKMKPKRKKGSGICQQVIKLSDRGDVDLTRLPLIKCWPSDGDPRKVGYEFSPEQAGTAGGEGRYITFAGIHTIHADDRYEEKPKSHNIGMYRVQLLSPTTLAMHWHVHHDGAAHWRSWKEIGEPMPVAICLGGESVLPYAATAPLPPGMSELLMAGFLNKKGIELVKAKTVPLSVPANSEFVIEGYVNTACGDCGWEPECGEPLGEGAVFEGPFGDHTGFYSMPDRYPICKVTALTHRKDPIFPATVVGPPPQEDYYLGKATERIMLPLLQVMIPEILDYHLPMFGTFHNCLFVKIKPAYLENARKVMHAIWGAGQLAWTKIVIVVNDTVDVHNEREVFDAVAGIDIHQDLEVVRGPLDILDHAAPKIGSGGKLGIDATNPSAACGIEIVGVSKNKGGDGVLALEQVNRDASDSVTMLFAVDDTIDTNDLHDVFFNFCASFDPTRDLHYFDERVGFDGTTKMHGDERNGRGVRPWPPPLVLDSCN